VQVVEKALSEAAMPRLLNVTDDGLCEQLAASLGSRVEVVTAKSADDAQRLLREGDFALGLLSLPHLGATAAALLDLIEQWTDMKVVVLTDGDVSVPKRRCIVAAIARASASAPSFAGAIADLMHHGAHERAERAHAH
jgi:DNA-binding NtrC family response regulator